MVDAWRRVSIRHGFEQVDGPIYESLELYKVKSGEGIVSELFHFEDRAGRELAIRAEFTPTLARMVAAKANALSKPIKWFAMPNVVRAEKPQRGRSREHWQWNVDLLGVDSPTADAEVIFTAVDALAELGLGPEHVRVKISHRKTVRHVLTKLGVPEQKMIPAFELLDRRDKIDAEHFAAEAGRLGLDEPRVARFDQICRMKYSAGDLETMRAHLGIAEDLADLENLDAELRAFGIAQWCEYDLGIVRGLAYYTGTVFEIHEVSGVERALAGGGRYDGLIELFGGPAMPAVGVGMGDVVLSNVLADKGLIPQEVMPRPDVFVVAASDEAASAAYQCVASLRRQGIHARFSYRSTRNIGRLLKEASGASARFALILGGDVGAGRGMLKDMDSGEQKEVGLGDVAEAVKKGDTRGA